MLTLGCIGILVVYSGRMVYTIFGTRVTDVVLHLLDCIAVPHINIIFKLIDGTMN